MEDIKFLSGIDDYAFSVTLLKKSPWVIMEENNGEFNIDLDDKENCLQVYFESCEAAKQFCSSMLKNSSFNYGAISFEYSEDNEQDYVVLWELSKESCEGKYLN